MEPAIDSNASSPLGVPTFQKAPSIVSRSLLARQSSSRRSVRPTTKAYHPRSSEVPIDPRLLDHATPQDDEGASQDGMDDAGGYGEEEGDDMGSRETQIILQRITQQGIDIRRIATAVDRLQVQMQVFRKT